MANTYTQINIQAVFSVKGRQNLLTPNFRYDLFRYISGILNNINQYPLAVNGYLDHVHLFFELHPTSAVADVLEVVKANSSKWINKNKFLMGKFAWQKGYGAFSYSRSQRDNVIQYILKQEEHHKKSMFREEYLDLLKKFEIPFKDEYVFQFYDLNQSIENGNGQK